MKVRKAIRNRNEKTFGIEHTPDLAGSGLDIGYVVQHVRCQHEVEGTWCEGKALHVREDDLRIADMLQHSSGVIYGHSRASVSSLDECQLVYPIATADIEDTLSPSLGDSGEVENPGDEIKARYPTAGGPQPLT